ncbi:MAG TPA: ABC transporter permease [Lachnospiraceae bacterium]|nr:ABC transporter permease [Lachnospiraceae bacterium]
MKSKLAVRNVKRQIGNYLIYFVTITVMMGLLFAINNLSFSDRMQNLASLSPGFRQALTGITVFCSLITALVMGYATSFMVKLRKKEFGMYLTMGMDRKDIQKLFLMETCILSLVALVLGFFLGILLSQILSGIFSLLMDVPVTFLGFPVKGVLTTVAMSVGIFFVSSVSALWYLRKVNIIELLRSEKKEKSVKHFGLHVVLTVVFGACTVFAVYSEYQGIMASFRGEVITGLPVVGWLLGIGVSVFLFHIEFAKSLTGILLRCKKFATKYTNTVILRNVSGIMNVNSLMMGALATIMVAAVSISSISFVEKKLTEEYVAVEAPFDIVGEVTLDSNENITIEEAEKIITKYTDITAKYELPVYSDGQMNVVGSILGADIMGWTDKYVKLSDINNYLEKSGNELISLESDQFVVVSSIVTLKYDAFKDIHPVLNGTTYSLAYVTQNFPLFLRDYIYVIISDEAVEGMDITRMGCAYSLKSKDYDYNALYDSLYYDVVNKNVTSEADDQMRDEAAMEDEEEYEYIADEDSEEYATYEEVETGNDFRLKVLVKNYYLEEAGILIIGMGYIASVFIFMALAILALKVLSGINEDVVRYEILDHLGVDRDERKKTLYKQIGLFFFMPMTGPVLLVAPLAYIFGRVIEQWGMPFWSGAGVSIIAAVCIFLIYVMYYLITCEVAKKEIIG